MSHRIINLKKLGSASVFCALLLMLSATAWCDEVAQARGIINQSGVAGGLVVHLGCGDGELTEALRIDDRYLVHGLDANPANIARARAYLHSIDAYGQVSVARCSGDSLPYANGIVNLIVAEKPGAVRADEMLRVLAPGGVALVKKGDAWEKTIKPWPKEIDEWSHFLHDASNNAVGKDLKAGPPRRLRWVCGPLWSRSHEFNSSLSAMVSSGGRVFYVEDQGLTGVTAKPLPERWTLTARDAFNGVLLWKKPLTEWGPSRWKNTALRGVPRTVSRSLVADGDRLYMTLGYKSPVSVIDAATGDIIQTYAGTEGTEELRLSYKILLLSKSKSEIQAFDTKTGKRLWQHSDKIEPLSLATEGGRVFYQADRTLHCRLLGQGKELWRAKASSSISLLLSNSDRVFILSQRKLRALSVVTGRLLWTADSPVSRPEVFVASGRVWHWDRDRIVGRDLRTGKITARPDTTDVFTEGHHLRCYQAKATERFLITPVRGVEYVSLTGGEHTQNDWVRGPCGYGVMPANGLLYAPPNPCFCYPGVKIIGFNALAPAPSQGESAKKLTPSSQRLERGAAYAAVAKLPRPKENAVATDWPTYRHDARRSGAANCETPAQVAEKWSVILGKKLTPPVSSDGRVYVADKDAHTLFALDIKSGHELWHFTADGRIDSPPTIYGDTALFGSVDGSVYCLRVSDGQLAWRFRAAPSDEKIVAFGQLESPWRVHGSVLIKKDILYCTAGRSTYLDGGIHLFALDPRSGKVLNKRRLDTWSRTRKDAKNKPFIPGYHMEGGTSDILVSQGDYIYLGQYKLNRQLVPQKVPYVMPSVLDRTTGMDLKGQPFIAKDREPNQDYETHQRQWLERVQPKLLAELKASHGGYSLGQREMGLHLLPMSGFLDDSWYNRTFWMYSASWPGFYLAHRAAKTGQLLVVGPKNTYGVQKYTSRNLQSPLFTPGKKGYLLFADSNTSEPVLDYRTRGTTKGWGFTREQAPLWHDWVPLRVRAMVLSGPTLFVAGPPDTLDPDDPMAAFEGRAGGALWALSTADGKKLTEVKLDSPPVFDGMIAAADRLYVTTRDGRLTCYGEK